MKDALIKMALREVKGAIEAVMIPVDEIEVKDSIAEVYRDPGCHNYGA